MFVQINGAPRCGITLHITPTKKRRKKRDGAENKYLLQGKCKVFYKKTTHVCSESADRDAVKNEMWAFYPKKTVPVLHSMCISHMNLTKKYIIIKSYLFFKCHKCSTIVGTNLIFLNIFYSMLSTWKMSKNSPQLRVMSTSIEGKARYSRH